jgi:phage shock protein PspC (stress-responsive transcriptional regulator)
VTRLDHPAARDFDQDGRFGGAQLGMAFGWRVMVVAVLMAVLVVMTAAGVAMVVVVGHWAVTV